MQTNNVFWFACIIAAALIAAGPIAAQSNPVGPQNVFGSTGSQFQASFGGANIGANVSGVGSAGYNANGSTTVSGGANTNGGGSSTSSVGSNSFVTAANANIGASSWSNGDIGSQLNVSGQAGMSTWGGVSSPNASVGGGVQTAAGFNGGTSGAGPQQASGGATANGILGGSVSQTPNSVSAQGALMGSSQANMSVPGTTSTSGYGIITAAGGFGPTGGTAMAGGSYTGIGGQAATGLLVAGVQTSTQFGPGSVSTSSTASSTATGSNAPTTPQPPSCGCGH